MLLNALGNEDGYNTLTMDTTHMKMDTTTHMNFCRRFARSLVWDWRTLKIYFVCFKTRMEEL